MVYFKLKEGKKVMAHKNIRTKKKNLTPEEKKIRLEKPFHDDPDEQTVDYCWKAFIVNRMVRGCTEDSLNAYRRFYKKFSTMFPPDPETGLGVPNFPIGLIDEDAIKAAFITSLKKKDGSPVNEQTKNHYLRSYRAFGNFCDEEGYIPKGFTLSIKEVEPEIKDVYTDAELKKLLKEPSIEDFVAYRSYAIITLILTTGARSKTLLNLRICDFDPQTGYINFNTTKAHKVVKEGLDPTCVQVLRRYIERWRSFEDTKATDYLFCNYKEEQMSRSSLCKTIKEYNIARGVNKTSLHLFRHTFAKNWITTGGDIISLAKVLTHSELEMVKRYSNLYSTDLKKEVMEHSLISTLGTTPKKSIKTKPRN